MRLTFGLGKFLVGRHEVRPHLCIFNYHPFETMAKSTQGVVHPGGLVLRVRRLPEVMVL